MQPRCPRCSRVADVPDAAPVCPACGAALTAAAAAIDLAFSDVAPTLPAPAAPEEDAGQALRRRLQSAANYNGWGVGHAARGEWDQALRLFDEALRLDPGLAKALNNRGYVYACKRDYARALADFD